MNRGHQGVISRFERWFQPEPEGSWAQLIVDAVEVCLDRWGWSKTTLDDIAKEAGCSRATIYRTFPGGKVAVLEAHRRHAVARFFKDLEPALSTGDTLEEALVSIVVAASARLQGDEGFQRRLADDPGSVLPQVRFEGMSRVFALCRVFVVPRFERFLPRDEANLLGEWVARLVVSYAVSNDPTIDLSDPEAAADLVRRRILPGVNQDLIDPPIAIRTG